MKTDAMTNEKGYIVNHIVVTKNFTGGEMIPRNNNLHIVRSNLIRVLTTITSRNFDVKRKPSRNL